MISEAVVPTWLLERREEGVEELKSHAASKSSIQCATENFEKTRKVSGYWHHWHSLCMVWSETIEPRQNVKTPKQKKRSWKKLSPLLTLAFFRLFSFLCVCFWPSLSPFLFFFWFRFWFWFWFWFWFCFYATAWLRATTKHSLFDLKHPCNLWLG